MKVLNSLQIKNGAKVERDYLRPSLQPLQFLSKDQKTDDWAASNLDWWEQKGIEQIRLSGRRLLKNIKLSEGIIDKSDYIPCDDNPYTGFIEAIKDEQPDLMDLKFFSIIPNVINILTSEFASRTSKVMFVADDDTSHNEMLEDKRKMIEESLLSTESKKMQEKLIAAGMDPESSEFKENMSPDKIKSLPEIEHFFKKNYQSIAVEWATHQKKVDERRFKMEELEVNGFRDSLRVEREFWHFRMMESDYDIELWDPVFTFYSKPPGKTYISEGNVVGNIIFASAADIVDMDGYLMTEEQLESLETLAGARKFYNYDIMGVPNDGTMYDATKSYEWNREGPSLGMRQYRTFFDDFVRNPEAFEDIFSEENDDFCKEGYLRRSTVYWKTRRKLFHLTKITDSGKLIQKIVDEDYVVTTKPQFNTILYKTKDSTTLVYGEYLEALYVNETYGGIKISAGKSFGDYRNSSHVLPIYLGIDSPKPKRLKYQLKGEDSLYGCRLPVEGVVHPTCVVNLMKAPQINFNLVNNQISDILIDEIGPVGMIDQNTLPKHSLGEEWGPNNYQKAYESMKNYKLLGLDTSLKNTEGSINFQNYGMLNFDESARLASRINLAAHFRNQAMEVVGISPERLGSVQPSQSATGVNAATQNSFTQTEMYFIRHSDWLMPRVHEMRTNIAQYYQSTNPSLRLQYITSLDEQIWFEKDVPHLLLRNINVFCVSNFNTRKTLDQLKNFFIGNNTTGASLYDLGTAWKADSIAEMDRILKESEEKVQKEKDTERAHQEAMNNAQIQAEEREKTAIRTFESGEKQLDRVKDIKVAEIRSAGMPSTDVNADKVDDYMQKMDYLQKHEQFTTDMEFKREQMLNKNDKDAKELALKNKELNAKNEIASKQLAIAKVNRNKYSKD